MNEIAAAAQFEQLGLFAFKPLFANFGQLELTVIGGTWRASFTGPGWLRVIAPRGLFLLRFGGWWGKELQANGSGVNLFQRGGKHFAAFPITVKTGTSRLDGKPCLIVRYSKDAGFPWAHVIDELRRLDDDTLFGMTIFDLPGMRGFPLPFLLQRFPNALE